jgi:uncharacterized membrane protein YphA (DoxX/SURF4 family)
MSYRPFTPSLLKGAAREDCSHLTSWRLRGIAVLRIAFGSVWAIDAWFKWRPGFSDNFTGYLTKALDGQPPAVTAWLNFWIHIVGLNPHLFAFIVATGETGIALGLLFGALSNLTCLAGILLSLSIWSIVQGFGGLYGPGSSDVGVLVIIVLVFTGLFLGNAGTVFGLDRYLSGKLGRWSFLASRRGSREQSRRSISPVHAPIPLAAGYPQIIHSHAMNRSPLQPASHASYGQRARQLYLVNREADQDTLETAPRGTAASNSRIVSIRGQRLSRM